VSDTGSPFDAAVFAGGGTRCFWQLGFWSVAAPALGLAPERVAAVSAGAAAATAALIGKPGQALERFKAATAANPRNVYPARALAGHGERVFPHEAIYRATIEAIVDAQDLQRLHAGPELRIMVTHPPRWLGPRLALAAGLGCYLLEKRLRDPLHGSLARRIGFRAEAISARACPTPRALADLILASSCTPPFTTLIRRGGRPVLDGSLVDAAPVSALSGAPQRVLVLLTRRYRRLPADPGRTYVQPSALITLSKWDYTSPRGLQETYDLGRRDADRFVGATGARGRTERGS